MRYAWDFDAERWRFPAPIRPFARAGTPRDLRGEERGEQAHLGGGLFLIR
jgi:hypothetical protein